MTDTREGTERVLVVGVDGSERSLDAVDWAAAEAAERGMSLRICHVGRPGTPDRSEPGSEESPLSEQARTILATAVDRARRLSQGARIEERSLSGHPAKALVGAASDAEALVLGSRGGGGFGALLLGSVSEQVAAHSRRPVVVVRGRRRAGPIAVGVDGSPESQAAMGFAFARAADLGVPVRAVHAYTLSMAVPSFGLVHDNSIDQVVEAAKETLESALASWVEKYPNVRVTRRVVDELASIALVDESQDTALLVVGSRGHGGFTGLLLGSVSRHALRHCRCPVAVVRT